MGVKIAKSDIARRRIFRRGIGLGASFFNNLQREPISLTDITIDPEKGLTDQAGNFCISTTTNSQRTEYTVSITRNQGKFQSTNPQAEKTFYDLKEAVTAHYNAKRTLRRMQGLGEQK